MNIPEILWSQTKKDVNIKICINDYSNTNFDVSDNNVNFNCKSNNLNYNFSFQTFKDIKDYKISEIGNTINITLNKMDKEWWNKLTENNHYKNHIKVDWNKWIDEDDGDYEDYDEDDDDDNYHDESPKFDDCNMEEVMKMMQNIGGESTDYCSTEDYLEEQENSKCLSSKKDCVSDCCPP